MKKYKNKIVVFKLSSLAVTFDEGGINKKQLDRIVRDIVYLKNKYSIHPVIVSSGAINAGRSKIENIKTTGVSSLQACSAIGQVILVEAFNKSFSKLHQNIAQVLLTHEDLKNKKRSLNTKNTLNTLINNGIIPIINENEFCQL